MPKKVDPGVKARAVRLVRDHQGEYSSVTAAASAVAKQLGLGRETVRRWVVQAEIDDGHRDGLTSEEREQIRKLKAENARLREDVAILRAATSFFAGELDPRNR
jgi:transposase-like protein